VEITGNVNTPESSDYLNSSGKGELPDLESSSPSQADAAFPKSAFISEPHT
jgi:hypothetical protein